MSEMKNVPETELRVSDLWANPGHNHRVKMVFCTDLRCPCGSVYIRKSDTHHSCPDCQRVWTNETIAAILPPSHLNAIGRWLWGSSKRK